MFLGTSGSMSERCRLPIPTLRLALPRVAFLLVLIIVVHQFVMTTPAHQAIMPMTGHDMQASEPIQDFPRCPPCPVQSVAICSAVQAALPVGVNAGFLLLAVLVAVAFFVRVTGPGMIATADWRLPPRQTRVLFQTFRC